MNPAFPSPHFAITASEVCGRFTVPAESRTLLREGMGVTEFIRVLIAAKHLPTALDFAAYALEPREGIWWGCLCMRHAHGPALSSADMYAARAAVQWIMQPSEQNRTAAKPAADAAGPTSACASLALAAFQTPCHVFGGEPQPAPYAWASWVSRAVKLSALKAGSVAIPAAQKSYAGLSLWVAENNLFRDR